MGCTICGKRINIFGSRKLKLCSTHFLETKRDKKISVKKGVMTEIHQNDNMRKRLVTIIGNYQKKIGALRCKYPKSYKDPRSALSMHYNTVDRMLKEVMEIDSIVEELRKKIKE